MREKIQNPDNARFVADAEKNYRDEAAKERGAFRATGKTEFERLDRSAKFDALADRQGFIAERAQDWAERTDLKTLIELKRESDEIWKTTHDPVVKERVEILNLAITRKKQLEEGKGEQET